jgi:class 3 adenylate cyclase
LDKLLGEAADPCSLQIFKKTGLSLEEIYKEYGWRWGELPLDMVWANQSTLKRWGQKNLKTLIQFMDNMVKPKSYAQMMKSVNVSSLVRGDLQPKRHMYFYYGSKPGVREEACASIIQVSPVLVEVKHKIYYGQLYQTNAPLKYPKEVKNAVSRAHAVFKYTETALTIFTPCGTILQQNPSSSKIFGMEACGNNVFSDFGKDGKPVNRLRALFGGNESQYRDMMETVMEEDEIWWAEMKLGREDLMNLGRTSLSDSTLGASGDGQKEEEEVTQSGGSDSAVWYIVHLSKFSDPADGKTTIFCEMKNIHAAVLQEERLREAKKHEYEILQNIIPKHIIDHLIQKEKEVARARSPGNSASRSSTSSDDFLDIDISAFRMIDDDKVGAMAQHYSQVTVFFADIVGFTNMSSHSTPADIMIMLNRLFTLFDDICDNHNIYKVETIGDAYMCVAGLNMKSEAIQGDQAENTCSKYHAKRMLVFAKDVVSNAKTVISPENTPVEVRIGLHTGDVVTGVVGYKMPRFCLFGDTVNVASRMESTGRAGHIHASQATRDLVPHEHWIPTGGVAVKGKGLVPTYTCGGCIEDGDLNPSDKICDCC